MIVLAALGASPAHAVDAITAPEARAAADVGVVEASDLPPSYATPPPRAAADPGGGADGEEEFYACLGAGQPEYLARHRGGTFLYAEKVGTPQAVEMSVQSQADVADAEDSAVRDQENLGTTKGARCYEKRLTAHLQGQRLAPKQVSVELVRATVTGADEAWAYRIRFVVTRQGTEVTRTGYVVGSRVGEALLSVVHLAGGRKVDLSTVLDLAAKPVARVRQMAGTA